MRGFVMSMRVSGVSVEAERYTNYLKILQQCINGVINLRDVRKEGRARECQQR